MKLSVSTNSLTKLLLVCGVFLIQAKTRADIGLGEVLGSAWTIASDISGETTLTPAYAVDSYYWSFKETGVEPGTTISIQTLKRARVTGAYLYHTKDITPTWTFIDDSSPIDVSSVNKLNTTCTPLPGVMDIHVETETEFVWLASVSSTGLFTDNGPWTVYLRTDGVKSGCAGNGAISVPYNEAAKLKRSGGQTVSIGTYNSLLEYPFFLANNFH